MIMASAEGKAVLDRIVAPGTPAAQRAAILRQLETFTDARVERYWQLLAVLNGQPVPPSVVPAFEWLIAALRGARLRVADRRPPRRPRLTPSRPEGVEALDDDD